MRWNKKGGFYGEKNSQTVFHLYVDGEKWCLTIGGSSNPQGRFLY